MLLLTEPHQRYIPSYADALEKFRKNGISSYGLTDPAAVDLLEKFDNYRRERNLPPDRVGAHFFWLVDDERERFIGEISIRHRLNDALLRYGGHIGYAVRMSEWRKGFGTLMLKLAPPEAKKLGLTSVLITCDDRNIGSAKVMENNGFILRDKVENMIGGQLILTRRYWKTL